MLPRYSNLTLYVDGSLCAFLLATFAYSKTGLFGFVFFFLLPIELTNLIIIRNNSSVEAHGSPTMKWTKFSHIQFQMIKNEDLRWVSMQIPSVPGLLLQYHQHKYQNSSHTFWMIYDEIIIVVVVVIFNQLLPPAVHNPCNSYITSSIVMNCNSIVDYHDPVPKLQCKWPHTVVCDGYNKVFVCFCPVRRRASGKDPSLVFLKATNQTFGMERNGRQRFSSKSLIPFTETGGRWVSSD